MKQKQKFALRFKHLLQKILLILMISAYFALIIRNTCDMCDIWYDGIRMSQVLPSRILSRNPYPYLIWCD